MSISEDIDINEIAAFQLQAINQRYTKMRKSTWCQYFMKRINHLPSQKYSRSTLHLHNQVFTGNLSTLEEAGISCTSNDT